jgi:hypothetical protein
MRLIEIPLLTRLAQALGVPGAPADPS